MSALVKELGGSWRPLRAPRQPLESQDAAVHLRPQESDPHHRRPRNRPRPAAGQEVSAASRRRTAAWCCSSAPSARRPTRSEARPQRCGMPFVNDRWLGGTLTNFRTIRSRLTRLEELEAIRDGEEINTYSKKMQSALNREYRKMYRNLNGIRTMSRLPECLIIVDPKKEKNAVNEAQKLGIATVVADRHRLRSRPGRPADSRQRRQHAVDRADREDAGRRDCRRQEPGGRAKSVRQRRRGSRRRRVSQQSRPRSA